MSASSSDVGSTLSAVSAKNSTRSFWITSETPAARS